ncbi:GNAT family N-acetyltransferase [Olivibacter domesticus]|uniref:N-acetyltransferase domain-containing protein n=1 Tax=Olivibacter domesticus TaxID=407022 RepID=A0A1H7MKG1_OLID1|nr:GNAT family N-acetyltransferase [Olivibacter domesticus]SEL11682.1 hypothetical protein SAMN05661044_02044 [Olivibacter domesticus]
MLIETYLTVAQYLKATKTALLQKELENNLILGICNQLFDQRELNEGYRFLNVLEGDKLAVSAISTPLKIILASTEDIGEEGIRLLTGYVAAYWDRQKGVVGPLSGVELFTKFFHRNINQQTRLCLYGLSAFKQTSTVGGKFVPATEIYRQQLVEWSVQFYNEIRSLPQKNEAAVQKIVNTLIETSSLFCWVRHEKLVSMAAIIRRTDHIAIVGMVYTPQEERGNGYALNCVKKLSEYIFRQGYTSCGLFTDKDYPISNKMYQKIGYEPVSDFLDVELC